MITAATLPLARATAAREALQRQLEELRLATDLQTLCVVDPSGEVWAAAGDPQTNTLLGSFAEPLDSAQSADDRHRLVQRMQTWIPGIDLTQLRWRKVPLMGSPWWVVCSGAPSATREAALFRAASYARRAFEQAR